MRLSFFESPHWATVWSADKKLIEWNQLALFVSMICCKTLRQVWAWNQEVCRSTHSGSYALLGWVAPVRWGRRLPFIRSPSQSQRFYVHSPLAAAVRWKFLQGVCSRVHGDNLCVWYGGGASRVSRLVQEQEPAVEVTINGRRWRTGTGEVETLN